MGTLFYLVLRTPRLDVMRMPAPGSSARHFDGVPSDGSGVRAALDLDAAAAFLVERVAAGAADQGVAAVAAVEVVGPEAAEELVVAVAAVQDVVAPAPPQMTSSPLPPLITSSPPRPMITSAPLVPRSTSRPGVPTIVGRTAGAALAEVDAEHQRVVVAGAVRVRRVERRVAVVLVGERLDRVDVPVRQVGDLARPAAAWPGRGRASRTGRRRRSCSGRGRAARRGRRSPASRSRSIGSSWV